jgi:hypothetical protein
MITCWLCQKNISSHVDDNTTLSNWARQHIESCPGCRTFSESAAALHQQLPAAAKAEKRESPPFLHGKIMAKVRLQERERQPSQGRSRWAIAFATACVLVAGVVFLRQPSTEKENSIASSQPPTEQALTVNLPVAKQVNQWTKNLDAPLENETQLVLNDAKTALDALKKSFLPENLVASSSEQAPR